VPRAKRRTPELRDRVLQVAVATLAGEGVAGFTTREVARRADTSTPAVYELFGDKAGLVREVFFEGFRALGRHLAAVEPTDSPRTDLVRTVAALRSFVADNPALAEVMFSRPFADFDPGHDDVRAGASVREHVVARVRRCVDEGVLAGDPIDVAHVLVALVQGLASQELAGWLGSSQAGVDRRWALAVAALLDGLAPVPRPPAG
jgi:AcrR family transcriptional regulator